MCASHGAKSPQASSAADVRQVTWAVDPEQRRPAGEVLSDAIALVDVMMREQRTPELAQLAASVVLAAGRLGLDLSQHGPDVAEEHGRQIADALSQVLDALLPVVDGDAAYRWEVECWAHTALSAALQGRPLPPVPEREPEVVPPVPVRRQPLALGPGVGEPEGRPVRRAPHLTGAPNGRGSDDVSETDDVTAAASDDVSDQPMTLAEQAAWLDSIGLGPSLGSSVLPRDRG